MVDDRNSLINDFKWAATILSIEWPEPVGGGNAERDWYDREKLSFRTIPGRQLLPAIPVYMAETKLVNMNVKDMKELANHLNPSASSMKCTSVPGKTDRLFTSTKKVYVSAACSVLALNVTSLLLVYQADLMLEMHNLLAIGKPNTDF